MNPNYSLTHQKIYQDYSSKTDHQLQAILTDKHKYNEDVIEIVADILHERNCLPEELYNNYTNKKINAENSLVELIAKSDKQEAQNNMIYGAIIGGAGIIVTLVTYMAASGGGYYVIASGAIIGGVYKFIKGANVYFD